MRASSSSRTDQALFVASSTLWHQRLGHPGSSTPFSFFHYNKPDGLCNACQLGKHVCLPFSKSSSFTSAAFQIIHCDLWIAPIPSLSGCKYYLTVVDDYSHFIWTFPLRLKSDVHNTLLYFHAFVRTHFHTNVGTIQCDNGKEFDNNANHQSLAPYGTVFRFSCP
jgi:histone deacetylase 1/2